MLFSIFIHILKKFRLLYLLLLALFSCSCAWSLQPHPAMIKSHQHSHNNHRIDILRQARKLYGARFPDSGKDSDLSDKDSKPQGFTPRPKVIAPKRGTHPELEKFMMMYTCKICQNRNAQMISKVAYNHGMVVSTCSQCKNKHLIADNQKKLDFPNFPDRVDLMLEQQGQGVQRLNLTSQDLEKYYLVDEDGQIKLVPKEGGQLSVDSTVVEFPHAPPDQDK